MHLAFLTPIICIAAFSSPTSDGIKYVCLRHNGIVATTTATRAYSRRIVYTVPTELRIHLSLALSSFSLRQPFSSIVLITYTNERVYSTYIPSPSLGDQSIPPKLTHPSFHYCDGYFRRLHPPSGHNPLAGRFHLGFQGFLRNCDAPLSWPDRQQRLYCDPISSNAPNSYYFIRPLRRLTKHTTNTIRRNTALHPVSAQSFYHDAGSSNVNNTVVGGSLVVVGGSAYFLQGFGGKRLRTKQQPQLHHHHHQQPRH